VGKEYRFDFAFKFCTQLSFEWPLKDRKSLQSHGKGGRETSTGKKGTKNPDPVAIYARRKTKKYTDIGTDTRLH
jgi:hypothetical protein